MFFFAGKVIIDKSRGEVSQLKMFLSLKKFWNPFCFACTLGLLPCLLHKAKWVQLINGKTLQVLKTSLFTTLLRVSFFCCHFSVIIKYIKFWSFKLLFLWKIEEIEPNVFLSIWKTYLVTNCSLIMQKHLLIHKLILSFENLSAGSS